MSPDLLTIEPEPFSSEDVPAHEAACGAASAARNADAANDGSPRSQVRLLTPAVLRVVQWHRQRAQARTQDGS